MANPLVLLCFFNLCCGSGIRWSFSYRCGSQRQMVLNPREIKALRFFKSRPPTPRKVGAVLISIYSLRWVPRTLTVPTTSPQRENAA